MPGRLGLSRTEGRSRRGARQLSFACPVVMAGAAVLARFLTAAALVCMAACSGTPQMAKGMVQVSAATPMATVPMIIDGDQIVIEIEVERPDGSRRKVLANLNMGLSPTYLQKHLYKELAIGGGRPLSIGIGGIPITVDPRLVTSIDDNFAPERQAGTFFFPRKVEASVQAGILEQFEVVLDYKAKTLTLAQPGTLRPEGVAVPIRLNDGTGLATVDAEVNGRLYPMVIDCGAGYTWARGSTVAGWLKAHPDWLRAEGAVGASNYNMVDYAFEKQGKVLQIPHVAFGRLRLQNVGIMGTGPLLGWPGDNIFGEIVWDIWQKDAPEPVVAWIGANVLKHYRLTIDYAGRMSYWLKTSEFDKYELDQVGVTLVYRSGHYFIGGIVKKNGEPTLAGAAINDEVVEIDGQKIHSWPRDRVFAALHGAADSRHVLLLERNGRMIELSVPVASF